MGSEAVSPSVGSPVLTEQRTSGHAPFLDDSSVDIPMPDETEFDYDTTYDFAEAMPVTETLEDMLKRAEEQGFPLEHTHQDYVN